LSVATSLSAIARPASISKTAAMMHRTFLNRRRLHQPRIPIIDARAPIVHRVG
jgi:hypothetical protein